MASSNSQVNTSSLNSNGGGSGEVPKQTVKMSGATNGGGGGTGFGTNGKIQFGGGAKSLVEKNGFAQSINSPAILNGNVKVLGNANVKSNTNGNTNGLTILGGKSESGKRGKNGAALSSNGMEEVITMMDECMDIDMDESISLSKRKVSPRKATNGAARSTPFGAGVKLELGAAGGVSSSSFPVAATSQKIDINLEVKKEEGIENNMDDIVIPPIIQKCGYKGAGCLADAQTSLPCKRCHRVFYCSEEHQELHFEEHKAECKTVSSLEVLTFDPQYSMWLKHAAPHLYDTCLNFILIWPSLTVQWLPSVTELENNMLRHHMLLGTMTNQEQNHLLVCGIDVIDRNRSKIKTDNYAAKYNGSLYIQKRINHEGEVNRARYMPQDPNIVATKSSSPEVFIIDCSKGPDVPENSNFSPLLRLRGHQKEGFGLSWSEMDAGKLLSGSNDNVVCLWDINKRPVGKANSTEYLDAVRIFKGHEDVVEDVDFNPDHAHIFASVGDDKRLIIWDARLGEAGQMALKRENAHDGDINVVAFSPFSEMALATGSSDFTVGVWDLRNIDKPLHSLEYHRGEVMQVKWSPHHSYKLASTGKDNRVFVWDLSKVVGEASQNDSMEGYDDDDAPPELSFIHGGHIANVNDISWNQHETGMIASVTEDNILQVWQISEKLQARYRSDSENESQGSASDEMED